jgi:hypothetical protein
MSNSLFCEPLQSSDEPQLGVIHDAIFQIADAPGLRLVVADDCKNSISEFLCSEISRNPSNIKNHIQRIWFQYDQEDHGLLFAALLDLWIALDGSGRALFKRLLLGAKGGLQSTQFKQLASLYSAKELRKNKLPDLSGSVLGKGVIGSLDLVKTVDGREEENPTDRDPLEEAHECLEYSQIDQAQHILEKALLDDPSRGALHTDLLSIYKSTRDLAALKRTKGKLSEEAASFFSQWDELQQQLSEELDK